MISVNFKCENVEVVRDSSLTRGGGRSTYLSWAYKGPTFACTNE